MMRWRRLCGFLLFLLLLPVLVWGQGTIINGSRTILGTLTVPTVIGGTGTGSVLALRSTSGVGATDSIRFQVGNNGATEAGRFNTSGYLGLNQASPTARLHIAGTDLIQNIRVIHTLSGDAGYASANRPIQLQVNHTVTDVGSVSRTLSNGIESGYNFGVGGVAAVGKVGSFAGSGVITGAGDGNNEPYGLLLGIRTDIGTGYTQTAGPVGRIWLFDAGVHGPIAVQPEQLNGLTLLMNNHYNGSPLDNPSGGIWLVTRKNSGPIIDATHAAANTYPMDVALGIVGFSNDGSNQIGWATGIRIGGVGSGWMESGASLIGTGIDISQTTKGISIHDVTSGPGLVIESTGGPLYLGATTSALSNKFELVTTTGAVARFAQTTSGTTHRTLFETAGAGRVELHFLKAGVQDWVVGQKGSATGNPFAISSSDDAMGAATKLLIATDGSFLINGGTTLPVAPGLSVTPPGAETIADAATITANACGSVKRITSAGTVTTNTTNTFTAPAAGNAGCVMSVYNSGAQTINLDANANFLTLLGSNVALTAGCIVEVASTGASGVWIQRTAVLCVA